MTPDGSQVVAGGYFDKVDGLTESADSTTPYNKAVIIGGAAPPSRCSSSRCRPTTRAGWHRRSAPSRNGCIVGRQGHRDQRRGRLLRRRGHRGGCFDGTWAANLSDGTLKWVNRCLGATQAIEVVGNYLYKGSHAHDCQATTPTATRPTSRQVAEDQVAPPARRRS